MIVHGDCVAEMAKMPEDYAGPTCQDCGWLARRLPTGQWTCTNPTCCRNRSAVRDYSRTRGFSPWDGWRRYVRGEFCFMVCRAGFLVDADSTERG
jgi:hypothetical protein